MDSRLGTGSIEGSLEGFGLVEGDVVLPDFLRGREPEVFVDQGNIDSESLGAFDGRHVPCRFVKRLELLDSHAPICWR